MLVLGADDGHKLMHFLPSCSPLEQLTQMKTAHAHTTHVDNLDHHNRGFNVSLALALRIVYCRRRGSWSANFMKRNDPFWFVSTMQSVGAIQLENQLRLSHFM